MGSLIVRVSWQARMVLMFLMMTMLVGMSQEQCNCWKCKNITEGIHSGTYYYLDSSGNTGTCLYRDPHTGKIIRACDEEASLGDSYLYELCENVTGPEVCIDPPIASDYGFLSRTWEGRRSKYPRLAITVSHHARLPATMGQLFMIFGAQLLTFHDGSLLWAIMTYHAVCLTKPGEKKNLF